MTEYLVSLPWPDRELHSNSRANRFAKARKTKKAREWARVVAKGQGIVMAMADATIEVEYYPRTRRGDVHNVPTSLKAYIDGIADAMGCDDKNFVVKYPTEFAGTCKQGTVLFHIKPKTVVLPVKGTIS